jgi:hypothetical protein
MEINAITVADWVEKMNKNTVKCLNGEHVAGSSTWVAFAGPYDAVHNQVEVTYDNGNGDIIRATFFQLQGNDTITARAAIESIMHQSARMNITNMRRHYFIDCMEFAERDRVDEKKRYWYFREHAKEYAYNCGCPWTYGTADDTWGYHLSAGLSRAFVVGEKRQNRVGVSDAETVAHAALSKRLDTARNTIELLDSTQSELIAAGNACDGVFNTVKVNYDNSRARCYMNPYNNCMFAKIPCEAEFKLNTDKCAYANARDVREGTGVSVSYNLVYDEQFDTVTVSDFGYYFGYYMSHIRLKLDNNMQILLDITRGLNESDVFGETTITVPDFKTKVLDAIVNRVNKAIAAKAAIA